MKKKLSVLLIMIISGAFILSGCGTVAEGASGGGKSYNIDVEDIFNDFLDSNPNRTTCTDAEKTAAEYIRDAFIGIGIDSSDVKIDSFEVESNSTVYKSQNVKAVYNCGIPNSKDIIIGCSYDNWYDGTNLLSTKAEGAYATGSSVAALLTIAEYIVTNATELNYNLIFAVFGAGEMSIIGAQHYVFGANSESGMTLSEIANTVLMIDIGSLGAGDYTYLYCDERQTPQETFFLDKAKELNGVSLRTMPKTALTTTMVTSVNGTGYAHTALFGNQSPFMAHNIKTARIFSQNLDFSLNVFGDRESENHPNVRNTARDTREKLNEYYPDNAYIQQINNAVEIILNVLVSDTTGLLSVMEQPAPQYGFFKSIIYSELIKLIIIAAGFFLSMFWANKIIRKFVKDNLVIFQNNQKANTPPPVFGNEYEPDKKKEPEKDNKNDKNDPFEGY